ncbi:hypothetical protein [Amnibacterium kyonggiense]|uniref:Uncharacterized protein n=1 Tax=Amnibacterium kyonggiense TaxID=595671 RepID=A0A4R7FRI6_9MICO|nr:hypothetical protein [Amnibacterium kyonggiense]TDS80427.1 hypothetical protein CLV52_0990 [Amnibacterium kyonggiense]
MKPSAQRRPALLRLDRGVVFVALLLLGTLALSSPLLAGINGMRISGCHTHCSTALVGAGDAVIMGGPIGATVLVFLNLLLAPHPDRYLWWLPCSALAVATAALLIGDHLITIGAGGIAIGAGGL